jgi:adenosylmethionine-8-amino-7-oxononanoate aminotransferase
MCPPLVVTPEEVATAVEVLDHALERADRHTTSA